MKLSRLDVTVFVIVALVGVAIVLLLVSTEERPIGEGVMYLSPAYGGIQQVWLTPLDTTQASRQLTQTPYGVYDFDVSTDGKYLVYAQREEAGLHELYKLNLQTKQIQRLTNCVAENADCRTPRFRPTGGALAYERVTVGGDLGMGENTVRVGYGAIRLWLLDYLTPPFFTQPLAEDPQFVGHSPRWARGGDSIAFYSADIVNPGVMVYHFAPQEGDKTLKFIPSQYGTVGALSPNGKQLIFPELTRREDGQLYTYLRLADLDALEYRQLTNPDDPIDDTTVEWHPEGTRVMIERRYTDNRYTRGYQLFWLALDTGETTPFVVDDAYNHGFFAFNEAGTRLVIQRFPFASSVEGTSPTPEIWVADTATGALTLITDNAFHPRWFDDTP